MDASDTQVPTWVREMRSGWVEELAKLPQDHRQWMTAQMTFPDEQRTSADPALKLTSVITSPQSATAVAKTHQSATISSSPPVRTSRAFEAEARQSLTILRAEETELRSRFLEEARRFRRHGQPALAFLCVLCYFVSALLTACEVEGKSCLLVLFFFFLL